jgi:hypothetical protein
MGAGALARSRASDPQSGAGGDHGRSACVDRLDDLGCIDPVEIDRRHAKVDMAELALDHVERHPLAGHLNGMGVAKLVWREASPHSGPGCDAA